MKLLIRNLARTTTESEIKDLFDKHGLVQECTLVMDAATGQSKGFGFLEMPNNNAAKDAIKALNGTKLAGSVIRVKEAQDK